MLTYHDGRDGPDYRLLLHQLREGRVNKVAFVKPSGASWPLALYDLALITSAECAAHGRSGVELSLVTPEEEPLGIFGPLTSLTSSVVYSAGRNARKTALLPAVVHQPVFADVQISRARAAAPIVRLALRDAS